MQDGPWHVLHVIANHEKRVAQHLSARSLEHYRPLYTERSRWTDRTVTVERPLFVGFVFVRYEPQNRLSVISTPGVIRLLGDDESETVSASEIDRIRDSLASGYLLRPHTHVPIGTRVRIHNGLFDGVEGIVTEFRSQCRVIIALSAIQQCFSLEVGLSDLEVFLTPVASSVVDDMAVHQRVPNPHYVQKY